MTDRFRKEYRKLSPAEVVLCGEIKDKAAELDHLLQQAVAVPGSDLAAAGEKNRAVALSRTKLEESVMWGIKAITQ